MSGPDPHRRRDRLTVGRAAARQPGGRARRTDVAGDVREPEPEILSRAATLEARRRIADAELDPGSCSRIAGCRLCLIPTAGFPGGAIPLCWVEPGPSPRGELATCSLTHFKVRDVKIALAAAKDLARSSSQNHRARPVIVGRTS